MKIFDKFSSNGEYQKIIIAICVAALLWFYMFSPVTRGMTNFWLTMTFSACTLDVLALWMTGCDLSGLKCKRPAAQVILGIIIALTLWGVFWVGDKASSILFGFARPQVDAVYSMKNGSNPTLIALLLLFLIGPAEEFFWRGFIQNKLQESLSDSRYPGEYAFIITAIIYAAVHIPSMNFMLVMAALTAGIVWGFLYKIRPDLLTALIVSHAVWDALIFVIIPI